MHILSVFFEMEDYRNFSAVSYMAVVHTDMLVYLSRF